MNKKIIPWILAIFVLVSINIILPHTDKIATTKTLEQNNYKDLYKPNHHSIHYTLGFLHLFWLDKNLTIILLYDNDEDEWMIMKI